MAERLFAINRTDGGVSIMSIQDDDVIAERERLDALYDKLARDNEDAPEDEKLSPELLQEARKFADDLKPAFATPESEIAKWPPQDQDAVASIVAITRDDIPADREFRNAWTVSDKSIGHDMEKARAIHLNNLRVERNALLRSSDMELLKAQENGDAVAIAALKTQRQALRDMPATIANELESATTIEQLKAVRPEVLSGR